MMKQSMRDRLNTIDNRDKEINEMMMDPSVLGNRREMARLGKEKVSHEKTVEKV